MLRRLGMSARSPYSAGSARGYPKMIAQNICSWKPDLVFSHHGRAATHGAFLEQLHKFRIPVAIYLCDEPYETGETARYSPQFDYVFTMDPCTIETHRKSRTGRSGVYYLPPGVNTDMFKLVNYRGRNIPAFFLGNADLPPRPQWLQPIERLIDGADIRFYPHKQRRGQPVSKGHPLWVSAEDTPAWYARCLVGLNVHRHPGITIGCYQTRIKARNKGLSIPAGLELAKHPPKEEGTGFYNDGDLPAAHVNPRFLEMAACGTLVVSDNTRPELSRMFPMAPRASDPAHFLELVQHYIDNPREAELIGQVCSSLISKRHSYRHRAAEVLIRCGFKATDSADLATSLGEPADWLTPQDFNTQGTRSSSEPIGRSERWSPAYGLSLIGPSGTVREASSLNVPMGWWS